MNKVLSAQHITKSYGKKQVLHDVSLEIEPGVIYGLLSILTAQNTWDAGTVTYGGEPVWENARALADICFSRELSPMMMFGENTYKVRDYLKAAATYYPHWDEAYAQKLVQRFGLETKKRISKLSKGMLSMVTIVLALASRAPVTILDEPVAGLDVVAREDFYKLLLEDYTETGRTFIISTHIIEEAANVFEKVIIMKEGAIAEVAETESFVASFSFVSGKDEDVAAVCAQLGASKVLHTEHFGRQTGVALRASLAAAQQAAAGRDVDVSPVNLQKAFVYLAGEKEDAPC